MTRVHRVRPFLRLFVAAGSLAAAALQPRAAAGQTPAPPPDQIDVLSSTAGDWSDEVPAHLAIVDGEGWLLRDNTNEAAAENTPLLAGDRLRTARGRIQILFADGSTLGLDHDTDASLLDDALLRLDSGSVRIALTRAGGAGGYRVDAAGTTAWIETAGEYLVRIDQRGDAPPDVRLLTIRGTAELSSGGQRTLVRAGYEAGASASSAPSLPHAVSVSSGDAFDRWWDDLRYEGGAVASGQYLPTELAYYGGVLDRYGEWGYEPSHGRVWYPRVDVAWQPYSVGRWSFVGSYGWVWIGADRWSWPTHHYGRWGWSGRRYYWIPGRRWAPAWVSWTSAPGYVGWCPIGFDDRPLVSVSTGFAHGWRSWTYLPSRSFDTRVVVSTGFRGRYLPPRDAPFARDYRGPIRPVGVTARRTGGLRGPSYAVPRDDARAGRGVFDRRTDIGGQTRGSSPFDRATPPRRAADGTAPRAPVARGIEGSRGPSAVTPGTPAGRELSTRPSATPGARPRWTPPVSNAAPTSRATQAPRPGASAGSTPRRTPLGRTRTTPLDEADSARPSGTVRPRARSSERMTSEPAPVGGPRQAPQAFGGNRPTRQLPANRGVQAPPDGGVQRAAPPRASRGAAMRAPVSGARTRSAEPPAERVTPAAGGERRAAPSRAPRVAPSRSADAPAARGTSSNGGGARARGR